MVASSLAGTGRCRSVYQPPFRRPVTLGRHVIYENIFKVVLMYVLGIYISIINYVFLVLNCILFNSILCFYSIFVNNILEKFSNSFLSLYVRFFCGKMSLKWEEPAGTYHVPAG